MMRNTHEDPVQLIACITEIAHRHGQRDYMCYDNEEELMVSSLCGLTVYSEGLEAVRISAHDLDVTFERYPLEAANDEMMASPMHRGAMRFIEGSLEELSYWYDRLNRLHNCLGQKDEDSNIICLTQVA